MITSKLKVNPHSFVVPLWLLYNAICFKVAIRETKRAGKRERDERVKGEKREREVKLESEKLI